MTRETSIDLHFQEIDALISKWRVPSVKIASKGVPPHITLLYPWRPTPITDTDLGILRSVIKGQHPFPIVFTHLQQFSNRVLYLAVNEESNVRTLITKITNAFPDVLPYSGEFPNPIPHLTIAKAPDDATFEVLFQEVSAYIESELPIELIVREIVVMEEGEDTNWKVHSIFKLDD
jgi:2'-5' RNA ligase